MTSTEILQLIGGSLAVLAGTFGLVLLATSFLRYQLLSQTAEEMVASGSGGAQALKLQIANRLGVLGGQARPFSVLLVAARAPAVAEGVAPPPAEALRSLMDGVVHRSTRVSDDLIPYEGDRTALILPCRLKSARLVVDRIRATLDSGPVQGADGQSIRLGASIGLVAFPDHGSRMEELHDRLVAACAKAVETSALLVEGEGAQEVSLPEQPHHLGVQDEGAASVVDDLTGVLRAEDVPMALQKYVARQRTEQLPVAVMHLDIDHFRRYVDRYGRPVADELLKGMSGLLQAHVREDDLIGRGGGDEFVIACPGGTPAEALAVARRVAAAVKKHAFQVAGTTLRLNVSVGVACVPEHELTGRAAYEAARLATRVAKARGRNLCVLYEPAMQGTAGSTEPVDKL